eukprot:365270-Chlamydomonas_euryale.AAC.22
MDVLHIHFAHFLVWVQNVDMNGGSDGLTRGHSFHRLRCIVGVKLTDRHRLATMREQCGTSSLELMAVDKPFGGWAHIANGRGSLAPAVEKDCHVGTTEVKTRSQEHEGLF